MRCTFSTSYTSVVPCRSVGQYLKALAQVLLSECLRTVLRSRGALLSDGPRCSAAAQ